MKLKELNNLCSEIQRVYPLDKYSFDLQDWHFVTNEKFIDGVQYYRVVFARCIIEGCITVVSCLMFPGGVVQRDSLSISDYMWKDPNFMYYIEKDTDMPGDKLGVLVHQVHGDN